MILHDLAHSAAVLLFGHDELIQSCTANYATAAICRKENLDRYDDRLMAKTNLIEAYDLLIDFIAKHTLVRFFLINGLSVRITPASNRIEDISP